MITLPTTAVLCDVEIADNATDTVWLRANLHRLDLLADVLLAERVQGPTVLEGLDLVGAAWHHTARLLVWQGYPHPLDEGRMCGEPRCSAGCAEFD